MSSTKKTSKKQNRQKLIVRIIALIMALIMVAGMAYYLVVILASSVSADTTTTVLNTSSLNISGDVLVSVGLMYGSNVTTGFEVKSKNKFTVGIQELTGEKNFEEIWTIDSNIISCASDTNLNKAGQTFTVAENLDSTSIGGYHIQIDCDDINREEFEALVYISDIILAAYGFYSIPAYIYTGYALRIGDFATYEQASLYYDVIKELYPEKVVTVVKPTSNAVSVLNPYNGKILFEYDCGQASVIGLKAYEPDENGNTYLTTPAGNVYDGVFAFKRYISDEVDGVSLINILPLESYLAGVLPFEISNSWPIEVQKEFAIAARSFTLTHLNSKHSSYGFDLCNTDCCEVYKGQGRVNSDVMEAVLGTAGKVISYNGSIVTSYYSSTVGGVTVSAADCWGGSDVPYLQAIETPWEDYMNHANGFWTYEVTPKALLERLQKAGYTQLQGEIASLEIVEFAKNSTYVKKLKATDIYGTSITITYTDKVRTSLTPYVKSANFVVGKGSVEYTEAAVVTNKGESSSGSTTTVITGSEYSGQKDKSYGYADTESIYVLTGSSFDRIDYVGFVNVLTASSFEEMTKKTVFVATRDTAEAYIGSSFAEVADGVGSTTETTVTSSTPEQSSSTETEETSGDVSVKVKYAEDPNNFVFVGKGWGHGVGMSQWGAYDLAVKGYKYDQIILAYFPTIEIVNYKTTKNFSK